MYFFSVGMHRHLCSSPCEYLYLLRPPIGIFSLDLPLIGNPASPHHRCWYTSHPTAHTCSNFFFYLYLSSRRASAQAVTSKRYIRATSPVNTYSSGVKTDFWRKTGRSQAAYESSRKYQRLEWPKFRCRRFRFSRWWPETGCFGSFPDLGGSNWRAHFLMLIRKERCTRGFECTKWTLSPYY